MKGETVFVLGGGPSLRGFDFERLRGRRLIAVNALGWDALQIAQPEDVLFSHDADFFIKNEELVTTWPGLILSISGDAVRRFPRIRRVVTKETVDFVTGHTFIKRGRSSGHTAISLAIAMSAARVVLLGFDMRVVGGRSHSHDRYGERRDPERLYRVDFLPRFRGWGAAAHKAKVQVLNATPGSALREFPMIALADVL